MYDQKKDAVYYVFAISYIEQCRYSQVLSQEYSVGNFRESGLSGLLFFLLVIRLRFRILPVDDLVPAKGAQSALLQFAYLMVIFVAHDGNFQR